MGYDNASWHYGGDYPDDLPPENGATHAGMFLAWAVMSGLAGEELLEDGEAIARLRERGVTPGAFLIECCDEKLGDDDLNDEGNAFAREYYGEHGYFEDYAAQLAAGFATLYHVPDAWETFDRLRPLLDRRLADWREGRGTRGERATVESVGTGAVLFGAATVFHGGRALYRHAGAPPDDGGAAEGVAEWLVAHAEWFAGLELSVGIVAIAVGAGFLLRRRPAWLGMRALAAFCLVASVAACVLVLGLGYAEAGGAGALVAGLAGAILVGVVGVPAYMALRFTTSPECRAQFGIR